MIGVNELKDVLDYIDIGILITIIKLNTYYI